MCRKNSFAVSVSTRNVFLSFLNNESKIHGDVAPAAASNVPAPVASNLMRRRICSRRLRDGRIGRGPVKEEINPGVVVAGALSLDYSQKSAQNQSLVFLYASAINHDGLRLSDLLHFRAVPLDDEHLSFAVSGEFHPVPRALLPLARNGSCAVVGRRLRRRAVAPRRRERGQYSRRSPLLHDMRRRRQLRRPLAAPAFKAAIPRRRRGAPGAGFLLRLGDRRSGGGGVRHLFDGVRGGRSS